MSQREFARALKERCITGSLKRRAEWFGVHETTFMRWLKGEVPIPEYAVKILEGIPKKN